MKKALLPGEKIYSELGFALLEHACIGQLKSFTTDIYSIYNMNPSSVELRSFSYWAIMIDSHRKNKDAKIKQRH